MLENRNRLLDELMESKGFRGNWYKQPKDIVLRSVSESTLRVIEPWTQTEG